MQLDLANRDDTIVAIATPPGKGGIGVIRISGDDALKIGRSLTGLSPAPKQATFCHFKTEERQTIDSGYILYFVGPHSFTGEDVIEVQGHGGPVVQDLLLQAVISQGARQARPGEFSERAFLNNKIDLTQAEAIADLINSGTTQAAKGAMRSLQGEFSSKINELLKSLIALRMHVEAAIDFPEEEIDFLADPVVQQMTEQLIEKFELTLQQTQQGTILKNGIQVVLAGKPNVGKSSLLNALSGEDAAIVTEIAGTTRDIVSQTINVDGLVLHIIDTAGLRDSDDTVELIGIERAQQAMQQADHILLLREASDTEVDPLIREDLLAKTTVVTNKIDLTDLPVGQFKSGINLSAKFDLGIDELKQHLKEVAGLTANTETIFTARRRHINALERAYSATKTGLQQLQQNQAGELLAAELLQAQQALSEITGEFRADDLLGEIFSGFCIGK